MDRSRAADNTEHYANQAIETHHGRHKARLRSMRGLKRLASASTIGAGHAFVQNQRSGHYESLSTSRYRIAGALHSTSSHHASDVGSSPPTSTRHTEPVHVLLVIGALMVLFVIFGIQSKQRSGSVWGKGGRPPWPTRSEYRNWKNRRK